MVILRESEKQLLDMLKARLARVERGEMWDPDHPPGLPILTIF